MFDCGTALTLESTAHPRTAKTPAAMTNPHEPCRAEDTALRQVGAVREQNRKDNKDGDGTDVDENLREAGELRVEFKKEQRRGPAKATVTASAQVNKMLEQHRCKAAGQREGCKQIEDRAHRSHSLFSIAVAPAPKMSAAHLQPAHQNVRRCKNGRANYPALPALAHEAPQCSHQQVKQREGQNKFPGKVHQLVLAQAGAACRASR